MQTIEQGQTQYQTKAYSSYSDNYEAVANPAAHRILNTLLKGYAGPVAIKLWDGSLHKSDVETRCVVHIHHPGVLRDLIWRRDLVKVAESFITGHIDVIGDLEILFQLERHFQQFSPGLGDGVQLLIDAWRLPSLNHKDVDKRVKAGNKQQANSRQAISHHYDVGNDFYRLWLDQNMVYSCAYFRDTGQTLDQAQQDKLDYLCRKLRLQPGQTLLDIGCGWGALAVWAAKHYGVKVYGITLSKEQLALASGRVQHEGLEDRIEFALRDYRDLSDTHQYDRIVSVGMFEHIGVKNFPVYFGKIKRLLKPGGLFLNHGITIKDNLQRSSLKRFINQYIFPDGELTRISDVNDAMEQAGFEIIDVESLRRHYALTLRRWVQTLEEKSKRSIELTSQETYRLWRLYMSGFAYYFEEGTVNLHQILAVHQHDQLTVPLRREDIYL